MSISSSRCSGTRGSVHTSCLMWLLDVVFLHPPDAPTRTSMTQNTSPTSYTLQTPPGPPRSHHPTWDATSGSRLLFGIHPPKLPGNGWFYIHLLCLLSQVWPDIGHTHTALGHICHTHSQYAMPGVSRTCGECIQVDSEYRPAIPIALVGISCHRHTTALKKSKRLRAKHRKGPQHESIPSPGSHRKAAEASATTAIPSTTAQGEPECAILPSAAQWEGMPGLSRG